MSERDDETLPRLYFDRAGLRPSAARTISRRETLGANESTSLVRSLGDGRPHTWLVRLHVSSGDIQRVQIRAGQGQWSQDVVNATGVDAGQLGPSPAWIFEGESVDVVVTAGGAGAVIAATLTPDPTTTPWDAIPATQGVVRLPPITTQDTPGPNQQGLIVRVADVGEGFAVANSAPQNVAVAVNSRLSLLTLFRNLGNFFVRIRRIDIFAAGGTGGTYVVGIRRITAHAAGTSRTAEIVRYNPDVAPEGTTESRQAGTIVPAVATDWIDLGVGVPGAGVQFQHTYLVNHAPPQSILCRFGQAEGIVVEVVVTTALTTSPGFTAAIHWVEEQ